MNAKNPIAVIPTSASRSIRRVSRDAYGLGLDEAVELFIKSLPSKHSDATRRNYRAHLLRFCAWLRQQDVPITGGISPDNLQDYKATLIEREVIGQRKASTINNHLSPIRSFLVYLITEEGVFERTPDGRPWITESRVKRWMDNISDSARPTRKERALDVDESFELLAVISHPRDLALFALLLGSGLRVSEACVLRAGDLEVRPDGAGIVHVIAGKGGKDRRVLISAEVTGRVYAWANLCDLRLGDARDVRGLWPGLKDLGEKNRPITRFRVYELLNDYAKTAGITHRVSPHNLRHTFGTEAYRLSHDPQAVASTLGHSGLGTLTSYIKDIEMEEAQPITPRWERKRKGR
jgi:site-specific recombinase XerD